jgi:Nuclear condensing complex subunits, C-term domain
MTNDRSIQYKCLVILCELLKNEDVFQVTLGFADIFEHFVMEMVKIDEEHLIINSLEALGLYCMHTDVIATKYLPMFYVMVILNELFVMVTT